MSDLVNYNKRGVGLPVGCGDLIDLLRHQDSGDAVPRLEDFEVARDDMVTGAVSDLEINIRAFRKFCGPLSQLRITEPDDQITVLFRRRVYADVEGSISIPLASPHQQAVRSFLKNRGLRWPEDFEFPKAVYPAISVQIFQDLTPVPTLPAELWRLTFDFFLHVGLEAGSSLQFHHWMIAKKGQ